MSFAYRCRFSFLINMRITAQTPISGKAMFPILNSPNPITAAKRGSIGDQIFAQKITPIALGSAMTPAPTNAKMSNDTSVLLWSKVVVRVPVHIAIQEFLVYFWRKYFSFLPPR